jgi:hypothetical protein
MRNHTAHPVEHTARPFAISGEFLQTNETGNAAHFIYPSADYV